MCGVFPDKYNYTGALYTVGGIPSQVINTGEWGLQNFTAGLLLPQEKWVKFLLGMCSQTCLATTAHNGLQ